MPSADVHRELELALAGLKIVYGRKRAPHHTSTPAYQLASAVVEYFGDEPIDALLTSDQALRRAARAIVAASRV